MVDPVHNTKWWRSDTYAISNNAIRPTPGANLLTYNPWETFEGSRRKPRTVSTLWGEFAETVRQIRADAVSPYTPSKRGEALVLDWSARYGLLGILPGRAQTIVLPPTYERAEEYMPKTYVPSGRCMVQRKYAKVAGTWLSHMRVSGEMVNVAEVPDWSPGDVIPLAARLPDCETPQTLYWEWEELEWKTSKANEVLWNFFSNPPIHGQYPQPLTTEFWATYQEPIWAWMRAAGAFCESMRLVSDYALARYAGKDCDDGLLERVNNALWILNSLAASESYWYEFGPVSLKRESGTASLLSVMAEIFFLDVGALRRLLGCTVCARIFVSKDRNARYCSVRCRNTAQVRRTRIKTNRKGLPPARRS
jgi:hypothetical protein